VVPRGRVAYAIEALWDSLDAVQDWEGMLAYLLKDHSSDAEEASASSNAKGKGKGKGKANAKGRARGGKKAAQGGDAGEGSAGEENDAAEEQDAEEDDAAAVVALPKQVRLDEDEETLFVEVVVAVLTRVTQASAVSKKVRRFEAFASLPLHG
jgi:cohesin complex subunit SA-1/2